MGGEGAQRLMSPLFLYGALHPQRALWAPRGQCYTPILQAKGLCGSEGRSDLPKVTLCDGLSNGPRMPVFSALDCDGYFTWQRP